MVADTSGSKLVPTPNPVLQPVTNPLRGLSAVKLGRYTSGRGLEHIEPFHVPMEAMRAGCETRLFQAWKR